MCEYIVPKDFDMDKYIFDESNGLRYELQEDYYIPCLILPAEEEQSIGSWGQRHLQYIKEHLYLQIIEEAVIMLLFSQFHASAQFWLSV